MLAFYTYTMLVIVHELEWNISGTSLFGWPNTSWNHFLLPKAFNTKTIHASSAASELKDAMMYATTPHMFGLEAQESQSSSEIESSCKCKKRKSEWLDTWGILCIVYKLGIAITNGQIMFMNFFKKGKIHVLLPAWWTLILVFIMYTLVTFGH